jgi:hypothetical protein
LQWLIVVEAKDSAEFVRSHGVGFGVEKFSTRWVGDNAGVEVTREHNGTRTAVN